MEFVPNWKPFFLTMFLLQALDLYSKLRLIPKFNNLSCLQAVFPSLKHLILVKPVVIVGLTTLLGFFSVLLKTQPFFFFWVLFLQKLVNSDVFQLLHVPRCLLPTLECVEIKGIFDWGEEELKITSYFLENSRVLKKLVLSFGGCPQHYSESEIYEEIGRLAKGCGGCEVIIDSEF